MSFLEMFITFSFCLVMFLIIFMNLYLDEQGYKEMRLKTYKLYIFRDGTQILEKNISKEKLNELEILHGEIVEVIEDDI